VRVLSHRGYHFGAAVPENTSAAFERAIEFGVDGIETDIRLSADGEPILFHDRLAPDGRPIETLTRKELEETVGYQVPALAEVLTRWPDVFWNLEIKCVAAVDATTNLLKRHPRRDSVLVTSFRHDIVARCAQELDVACGPIAAHAPLDVTMMLEPWQRYPHVRTIVWDFNVADREIVSHAQKRGFDVLVYGTITSPEHRLCREWRLAGLITDYPDRAQGIER
jgi:glycerophosphoryl diester phosphodiesterase